MKRSLKVTLGVVIALTVAGVAGITLLGEAEEEYEFFTADVARGTIQNTVSATGTVEAVLTVQVGSQVSGQIQTLYADFNSVVSADQLLAKLDPRNFEAQLENSRASLVSAEARVRTAEADLTNARASLESALASLEAARVESERAGILYERSEELARTDLLSQTDLENSRATAQAGAARLAQAGAAIEQAEAQIISRQAGLEQAIAQVFQSEADVNRAEINLEYTDIKSPVDGVVISREVDVGQTVAASMSAPTLFMIANDLGRMRVNASIDEADIGKLAQTNRVEFTVDAFPNERFRGQIEEIRLNPQTVQNVVTYNVIVGVSNQDLKLKPGMTANISVTVDRRDDALGIPNAALRYNPPDVDPAQLPQMRRGGRGGGGGPGRDLDASADRGSETEIVRPKTAPGADEAAAVRRQVSRDNPAGGVAGGVGPDRPQRGPADGPGLGEGRGGGRGDRAGRGVPDGERGRPEGFSGGGVRAQAVDPVPGAAPGQLWDAGEKIRFQDVAPPPPRPGRVWVLSAQSVPEMRNVMLGITDGSRTEVIAGDLEAGDALIVGDSSQGADPADARRGSVFGGFGGGFGGRRGFR